MSWARYLPQDRTKFSRPYWNSSPIWPSEPDVTVIKEIIASVLPENTDDFSIEFLAEGARHKVYDVFHQSWSKAYLFRIAVPLDPRLKMESEMATLTLLNQRTTIPVPKPIAWSSSGGGKLGYEWALVEKIPGVQLASVWYQLPWEKKVEITEAMAGFLVQLWAPHMRFGKIGSLYLNHADTTNHPDLERKKYNSEENQLTKYTSKDIGSLHQDCFKSSGHPSLNPEENNHEANHMKQHPSTDTYCLHWHLEESPSHPHLELVGDCNEETEFDAHPAKDIDSLDADHAESSDHHSQDQEDKNNEPDDYNDNSTKEITSPELDHSESSSYRNLESAEDKNEDNQHAGGGSTGAASESLYNDTFTIGPSIDGAFFSDRRRHLPTNRGPYGSCHDWLDALILVEQEFIQTAKVLLESKEDMTPEHREENWDDLTYEIGLDEEDMEEYDDMIALCLKYREVLSSVFSHEASQDQDMSCVLHHIDLSTSNIIVDPETFAINGIIDWEQTLLAPGWYGIDYPNFISDDEPYDEGEPKIPSTYDEESPEYNPCVVGNRDRWEAKQLRGCFDNAMEELIGCKDWLPAGADHGIKLDFLQGVPDLSRNPDHARHSLAGVERALEAPKSSEFSDKELESSN
ncbi:hypothetical protein G7054_g324 [Neopestalotiopsis clavispora]|nr:hypothetical protein G7054_g324 [Neopestalotiopsis clavispora]